MAKGKIIAGIDVGSSKICTIIASVSPETNRINVVGVSSQPSKGLRKSQIVDIEDAIAAITESVEAAERMAGYSLNSAFISISGAHIASQNSKGVVAVSEPEGEIIPVDVDRVIEAARAISLPASREILHVIPRDFMVDSQEGIKDPVGMTGVRLEAEAHIVTAASTAARNLSKCISETGINIDELVFSGLASAYSTISDTERELGVVLIDIGAGSTSICVFVEGSLSHSAVLPIGARNITNDLAVGMRISLDSAEKVKRLLSEKPAKLTLPSQTESRKERIERKKKEDELDLTSLNLEEGIGSVSRKYLEEGIIKPRLQELFQMISQELQSSGFATATPAGAVLTGGGAETAGIVEVGKRVLNKPVRIGIPKGLSGLIDEIETPEYATSIGLILYGEKSEVDLGPRPSLPGLPKTFSKIPVGSFVTKIKDLLKSFLP